MPAYKTVDPDESPDRINGYTGTDPEYQNRIGAVFPKTGRRSARKAVVTEEPVAPAAPEAPVAKS